MKQAITIIITVLVLALVTLAGFEWMARVEDKHPGSLRFSESPEISTKNNFFITSYKPLQDTLKLTQLSSTIHFKAVFAERAWRRDTSTFYLLEKKIPADVYNIIINYSEIPATFDFDFDLVPLTENNYSSGLIHYGNHLLLHRADQLQDTFWFNVREKSKDSVSGWIETGTVIGFARAK